MILDDGRSYFVYVCHPAFPSLGAKSYMTHQGKQLTNQECLEHWGKWIILETRERLDDLARKLDPYVERKEIPIIKYDRVPPKNLGGEVCAMLVFCDDRQRDGVWEILRAQPEHYADMVEAYEELTGNSELLAEFVPQPPGLVVAGYPTVAVYHFAPVRIYRVPE